MKRNNKKGFTIVELVIVIAVIAILSAVLIPTFGTVISDAQNTARDQEAKNLYTTYLANFDYEAGTPATSGVIVVDGYAYKVANGQISLTDEATATEAEKTAHLICGDSTCDHK